MTYEHYSNLGVDQNASDEDIKKAYKRKASKHHPDRGGDSETFQEIGRSYMVLSDPQRRESYDASGGQDDRKTGVDTVLAEAYAALGQQFNSVLEASLQSVETIDLVATILANVQKNRQAFRQQIAQQNQIKERMQEAQRRLSNNSENEEFVPVFENVISANLHRIDLAIKQMEHNIEVNLAMVEILNDYQYRKDEMMQVTFYGGTSSATTSGF